jgi:hypothetical protein
MPGMADRIYRRRLSWHHRAGAGYRLLRTYTYMTRVWKWPAGVLGLVVGLAVLVGFFYVFLAIGVPALRVSWWGLIYVGPVVVDIAILVGAVVLSRRSTQFAWTLLRNLLIAVWLADVLILFSELALASSGYWPLF